MTFYYLNLQTDLLNCNLGSIKPFTNNNSSSLVSLLCKSEIIILLLHALLILLQNFGCSKLLLNNVLFCFTHF